MSVAIPDALQDDAAVGRTPGSGFSFKTPWTERGRSSRKARRPSPKEFYIAVLATAGISVHLFLRYVLRSTPDVWQIPLYATLVVGGVPLVVDLGRKLLLRQFGSDLLAGISIMTAVMLGEYLVGSIVVLMLSGGVALEQYATRRASSVLDAVARRMPQTAHRKLVDRHSRRKAG